MTRTRFSPSLRRATVLVALAGCALAGCHAATPQTAIGKPTVKASKPVKPFAGNLIASLDPCGDQMHDLCGALLLYDGLKHRLPDTLEELQQFADAGQQLKFTCPISGKRYIYARAGLEAPGQSIRIFIYDAEPSHVFYNGSSNPWRNSKFHGKPDPADGGSRWCIYTKTDAVAGAPGAFADEIPERAFRQYAPAPVAPTVPPSVPPPSQPVAPSAR